MRDCVLRQKRRFQRDLGADPFAFGMRQVGGVLADSARSEFRTESGALDFVKLAQVAPGLVSHRAGDIDFQFYDCHEVISPRRHRDTEKTSQKFSPCLCVSVVNELI